MSRRSPNIPPPTAGARPAAGRRFARSHRSYEHGKRARGWERAHSPFLPPEDWHEPSDDAATGAYDIVVQNAGKGYRHAVTETDVRDRLAVLPAELLGPLEVVQLSRMTRKKQTLPCYGMQWGSAVYLYPVEESLVEHFGRPPRAAERREAEMYGGRWEQSDSGFWQLIWTPATIRDFYLNNILIHELGHLLDERNRSYADRERFADWFAIEYGYKPTRGTGTRQRPKRRIVRRHGCRR